MKKILMFLGVVLFFTVYNQICQRCALLEANATATVGTRQTYVVGATQTAVAIRTKTFLNKTATVQAQQTLTALTATPVVTDTVSIYPPYLMGSSTISFISITITTGNQFKGGEIYVYRPSGFSNIFRTTKSGNAVTATAGGVAINPSIGTAGLYSISANAVKVTITGAASSTINLIFYNLKPSTTAQALTWMIKENYFSSIKAPTQQIASAGLPTQYIFSPSQQAFVSGENPAFSTTPIVVNSSGFTWTIKLSQTHTGGSLDLSRPSSKWPPFGNVTATPGYIAASSAVLGGTPVITQDKIFVPVATAAAGQNLTFIYAGYCSDNETNANFILRDNALSMTLTAETPVYLGTPIIFNILQQTPTPINTIVPYTYNSVTYVSTVTTTTYTLITPSANASIHISQILIQTALTAGTFTLQGRTNSATAYTLNAAINNKPNMQNVNVKYSKNEVLQLVCSGVTTAGFIQIVIIWNPAY